MLTDEELDQLPFVTEVYEKNLDYLKYNSPYCQYPYVSMYTGRGCPARVHLLPVAAGHAGASLSRAQPRERVRGSLGDEGQVSRR